MLQRSRGLGTCGVFAKGVPVEGESAGRRTKSSIIYIFTERIIINEEKEETMKIVVIGATGTIGKAVSDLLKEKGHEVVGASRHTNPPVNIDKPESIDAFYKKTGKVDAVICAAGNAGFGAIQSLTDKEIALGIQSKLMGQVNLVRKGLIHLNKGGRICAHQRHAGLRAVAQNFSRGNGQCRPGRLYPCGRSRPGQ